jgi:hypothetical protein
MRCELCTSVLESQMVKSPLMTEAIYHPADRPHEVGLPSEAEASEKEGDQ